MCILYAWVHMIAGFTMLPSGGNGIWSSWRQPSSTQRMHCWKSLGAFQMQKDQAEEVVWPKYYEEVERLEIFMHLLSDFQFWTIQFEAACFLPYNSNSISKSFAGCAVCTMKILQCHGKSNIAMQCVSCEPAAHAAAYLPCDPDCFVYLLLPIPWQIVKILVPHTILWQLVAGSTQQNFLDERH